MSQQHGFGLSVNALLAERAARLKRDKEAEEQMKQREQERLAEFKQRLETFQITDANRQIIAERIRHAFERGDTELMFASFPSSFCTDSGRAIINAGEPPINKPDEKEGGVDRVPDWLVTLPAGIRPVYELWKTSMKPGGFGLDARIINYPGGMPGDVGLFFTWPKSELEAA